LYKDSTNAAKGMFSVPNNIGLGLEPNPDVIKTYKVNY
jgi:L-alanine-DL-glutamate epimerase-like enolase superfamily enzyme